MHNNYGKPVPWPQVKAGTAHCYVQDLAVVLVEEYFEIDVEDEIARAVDLDAFGVPQHRRFFSTSTMHGWPIVGGGVYSAEY